MSELVVDASVAVKWLVSEDLSDKASDVLSRSDILIAPAFLTTEVASVLWKKVRKGEIPAAAAATCLATLDTFDISFYPTESILGSALAIAISSGRSVYDSLYVALAEIRGCTFITADERLVNGLKQTRPTASAIWLGSL
jgi:predicted nucleic acid-binding protein